MANKQNDAYSPNCYLQQNLPCHLWHCCYNDDFQCGWVVSTSPIHTVNSSFLHQDKWYKLIECSQESIKVSGLPFVSLSVPVLWIEWLESVSVCCLSWLLRMLGCVSAKLSKFQTVVFWLWWWMMTQNYNIFITERYTHFLWAWLHFLCALEASFCNHSELFLLHCQLPFTVGKISSIKDASKIPAIMTKSW